jgi:hypothetical protein
MKLLELPEGMVSLEFEPSERDHVIERLKKFGSFRRHPQATFVKVSVGREQFIYENEWDDPCFISTSVAGANLLRQLAVKPARNRAA